MYTIIHDDGIEAAEDAYKEIRDSEADLFDLSEGQLNILGYNLMDKID